MHLIFWESSGPITPAPQVCEDPVSVNFTRSLTSPLRDASNLGLTHPSHEQGRRCHSGQGGCCQDELVTREAVTLHRGPQTPLCGPPPQPPRAHRGHRRSARALAAHGPKSSARGTGPGPFRAGRLAPRRNAEAGDSHPEVTPKASPQLSDLKS